MKHKKKIGIITFHWATNYGAVLQAYALQQYLKTIGCDPFIINFKPLKYDFSLIKVIKTKSLMKIGYNIYNLLKESKLKTFRKSYLNLSTRFYNDAELVEKYPAAEVYITGSDQVWNPYFLEYGGDRDTPSSAYFLSFLPSTYTKVAYAASFGTDQYSSILLKHIHSYLDSFNAISVREKTGLNILSQLNHEGTLVCDPTLLLADTDKYIELANLNIPSIDCFIYFLRDYKRVLEKKALNIFCDKRVKISRKESINDWLGYISKSKIVVTNSYHGLIFSIIFRKEFLVYLDSDSSMNDRFYTLLSYLSLNNRIINSIDENVNSILKENIDWDQVYNKLVVFINRSKSFIYRNVFES